MRAHVLVLSFLCLTSGVASAQEEPASPWSGKVGLGWLATSGNSETTNVSGHFDLGYKYQRWTHALGLLAIGAESNDQSTAESYTLNYKAQYDFREFDYVFGRFNYNKDKFSGVEQQTSETIGYGRRILNNDVHVLNLEAGLGFRQLDFADGTDDSGAIARLGGDYLYNFSDTAKFSQLLGIEIGSDNTYIESVSAVSAKLRDTLSAVFSYTIKNNSDVPAGLDKTDTFTSLSLEYGF